MKILELVGINNSTLELTEDNQNHIGTIHAGALFIFAENASGEYLQKLFPELKDKVMPLMRSSSVKYKKVAKGRILADAKVLDIDIDRFKNLFQKRARATVEVEVILRDEASDVVMSGLFNWFVHKI